MVLVRCFIVLDRVMMGSGSKVKNMDKGHIFVIMELYFEDISSKGKDLSLIHI